MVSPAGPWTPGDFNFELPSTGFDDIKLPTQVAAAELQLQGRASCGYPPFTGLGSYVERTVQSLEPGASYLIETDVRQAVNFWEFCETAASVISSLKVNDVTEDYAVTTKGGGCGWSGVETYTLKSCVTAPANASFTLRLESYGTDCGLYDARWDNLSVYKAPEVNIVVPGPTLAGITAVITVETDGVSPYPVTVTASDPVSGETITVDLECATAGGECSFDASMTPPVAGIYDVTVAVPCAEYEGDFLVVYDPAAGFTTGGGWFYSEAGSYKPDASAAGKASFGFVTVRCPRCDSFWAYAGKPPFRLIL